MSLTMPVVFIGHGNPINALEKNSYTLRWENLGTTLPRPKAILCISAHWFVEDTAVTTSAVPKTLYDFGGFYKELYDVRYPVAGDPELAARVKQLLVPTQVRSDEHWGLDHGAWSVLRHVYPNADVPVVQLSIDSTKPPEFHFELGKHLAPLRDEGILILGSGNVVHNLQAYAWRDPQAGPYEWAVDFEQQVKERLLSGQTAELIAYRRKLGADSMLAVPTPDHYLPLLYVLGARRSSDAVTFPVTGIDGGSVSMMTARLG